MIEIIVVSVFIVLTILYEFFMNVSPWGWEKKVFIKYLAMLEGFSLLVCVLETFVLKDDPLVLQKPEAGKSSIYEERHLQVEDYLDDDISIEVPARILSEDEISDAFNRAKIEIDESFLGQNESLDNVSSKVFMNGSFCDGLVLAEWRLDNYEFIYTDGQLKNDDLTESTINQASVYLTCQGETEVYIFPFTIVPVKRVGTEKFIYELKKFIAENINKDGINSSALLPTSFENYSLIWEKKKTFKGICIFAMGSIVLVGLGIGRIEEEKKNLEIRKEELKLSYSDMLSTLTLLLGAGMSVRKAWEKMIVANKNRAGPKTVIYEEMEIALNQMKTGMSESEALEEFAARTKLPCYKKMSGLLTGYIQKGSRDITNQLNNEVALAFEERKALAKIAGELAGTKLLLPMIMLLGVALVIIIVPALLSFSF